MADPKATLDVEAIDFAKGGGLVPVVAQEASTGAVLMVAFADREALERTLATGEMHYRSRSRGLWRKGATSGHTQQVIGLFADCDADTVLALVRSQGPACHTGATTCFGSEAERSDPLGRLDATIASRGSADPNTSYTARLLADRNLRLKKLGEEAAELAIACADGDRRRAVEETADLVYHAMVALRALGGSWDEVRRTLDHRAGQRTRTDTL
jgi:phosphoribosyl-ATP pyrophosphohydrolase/phosphoribosyl-AMP cyclohydrolase